MSEFKPDLLRYKPAVSIDGRIYPDRPCAHCGATITNIVNKNQAYCHRQECKRALARSYDAKRRIKRDKARLAKNKSV